jgi:hypothetical protein
MQYSVCWLIIVVHDILADCSNASIELDKAGFLLLQMILEFFNSESHMSDVNAKAIRICSSAYVRNLLQNGTEDEAN